MGFDELVSKGTVPFTAHWNGGFHKKIILHVSWFYIQREWAWRTVVVVGGIARDGCDAGLCR